MVTYTGPIQVKRSTTAEWSASTTPLREGEWGLDTTLNRAKLGDGFTLFPGLAWSTPDAATITKLEGLADAVEGATSPTDAATAANIADESSATRTQLDTAIAGVVAAIVPTATVVDLSYFLLPGEVIPSDGVTDAQPILQRALTSAAAAVPTLGGAVTIRLPAGRYRINSSVRWFAGYHVGFTGAGRANTKILPYGTAVFGLMDPSFPVDQFLDDVIISDMTIDCTNQEGVPENAGAKAIALRYMRRGRFERVRAINSWATAFGCDFLQETMFVECTSIGSGRGISDTGNIGAGFGIGVGNFDVETVTFVNCHSINAKSAGFFFERLNDIPAGAHDARGQMMTNCTTQGGFNGIRDAGADGLVVQGGQFVGASNAGLHIAGYTTGGRHGGRNGIFAHNVIRGCGAGIVIGGAATGTYTFDDNEITANIGAGVIAPIGSQVGDGWRFLHNRINRNGAGGIHLDVNTLGRVQIVGNTVRDNGMGDGIRLGGDVWEPLIVENTVQGHLGVGLHLPGAGRALTTPIIRRNRLTGNTLGGLVNTKSTDDSTQIADNVSQAALSTVTNHHPDPYFSQGVSTVAALAGFSAPQHITGASDAKVGTTYARATVTTAGTATVRVAAVRTAMSGVWTAAVWVRAPKDAIFRVVSTGIGASGAQRTWSQGGFRGTGDWQRIEASVTMTAGSTGLDVVIALDSATVGMALDMQGVAVMPGPVAWPSFAGDRAPAAIPTATVAWAGAAGASPSVMSFNDPYTASLAGRLYRATGAQPIVWQEGNSTGYAFAVPTAQKLTLYTVYSSVPVASVRSALRASSSTDRFATGRNSSNTAWVALVNDSSGASVSATKAATAAPAVVAAIRDASSVMLDVDRGITVSAPVASFEDTVATRVVNNPGIPITVAYEGAHDEATRNAVMKALADWFGIVTLMGRLHEASGQRPLATQEGNSTGSGISVPIGQPLTLYSAWTTAPAAAVRAALRSETATDRLAVGRNSGGTAWLAVANDAAGTPGIAQVTAAAAPAVLAAMRDASGVTLHVRGGSTTTAALASYEDVTATRVVNNAGVAETIVYAGAHDATKRSAVMAVLADWFSIT